MSITFEESNRRVGGKSITFEESNRRVGVRGQKDERTWSEIIIKPMCININLIDCFCIRLLSFLFRSGLSC